MGGLRGAMEKCHGEGEQLLSLPSDMPAMGSTSSATACPSNPNYAILKQQALPGPQTADGRAILEPNELVDAMLAWREASMSPEVLQCVLEADEMRLAPGLVDKLLREPWATGRAHELLQDIKEGRFGARPTAVTNPMATPVAPSTIALSQIPSASLVDEWPSPIDTKKSRMPFLLSPMQWGEIRSDPAQAKLFAAFEAKGLHFNLLQSTLTLSHYKEETSISLWLVFDTDGRIGNGAWAVEQSFTYEESQNVGSSEHQSPHFIFGSEGQSEVPCDTPGALSHHDESREDYCTAMTPAARAIQNKGTEGPETFISFHKPIGFFTNILKKGTGPSRTDARYMRQAVRRIDNTAWSLGVEDPFGQLAIDANAWVVLQELSPAQQAALFLSPEAEVNLGNNTTLSQLMADEIGDQDIDRAAQLVILLSQRWSFNKNDRFLKTVQFLYDIAPDTEEGYRLVPFVEKIKAKNPELGQRLWESLRLNDHFFFEETGGYRHVQVIKTREEFWKIVHAAKGPIVVDLNASWCGPCKELAPHYDELARRFKEKGVAVTFYSFTYDSEYKDMRDEAAREKKKEEVAQDLGITTIPDIRFYSNVGKTRADIIGLGHESGDPLGNMANFIAGQLSIDPENILK